MLRVVEGMAAGRNDPTRIVPPDAGANAPPRLVASAVVPTPDATRPAPARDAATVVLLRERAASERRAALDPAAAGELEVLLLRRHGRSGFAASMWVFPGGTVDAADLRLEAGAYALAAPNERARACGLDVRRTLALHVAAARETFEEAGILLAREASDALVDVADPEVARMRQALNERTTHRSAHAPDASAQGVDFHHWLIQRGLVLDLDALVPCARWITPAAEPRRYDTLFLLALAPPSQEAAADEVETTAGRWMPPADALAAHAAGELDLILPTVANLEWLAAQESAQGALAAAGALVDAAPLRVIEPHMEHDADGRLAGLWHPDDPDFPWDRYEGSSVRPR